MNIEDHHAAPQQKPPCKGPGEIPGRCQRRLEERPGSENTVALVKSAVAAANNAYEGLNKAAKQALDTVEANVTKATETGMQTSRRSAATLEA
jgi:hypothetical protein